jgi:hypothetical protein
MFLQPMGSAGHVVRSGKSGAQNIDGLFFKLGWARCSSHIKRIRTHYTELGVLHPVGYAGSVVHSGLSGA